jgi:flagellar biosynthetic protein FlhB
VAEQDQQRNEKATPWKLQQARKKGAVPKGTDLNSFMSLAVLTAMLYFSGRQIFTGLQHLFAAGLSQAGQAISAAGLGSLATAMFVANLRLWAATFVALMAAGALATLVQTGPVLSFTPVKPDFKRLSFAEGFKRFFNMKLVFDSIRAVLKAAILSAVIWLFIRHALPTLLGLLQGDVRIYPAVLLKLVVQLLLCCLLALVPVVLLDILLSRRDYMKRMMMSRREILDEHKQREGDPRIRARQRALQKEARQRSGSLRKVKEADVLITNPTRLAIALKYDEGTMPAPVVLAKGAGQLAGLMREMAWRHKVPIVQNRRLAASLFRASGLDQPIAASFYLDVARILIWLSSRTGMRLAEVRP